MIIVVGVNYLLFIFFVFGGRRKGKGSREGYDFKNFWDPAVLEREGGTEGGERGLKKKKIHFLNFYFILELIAEFEKERKKRTASSLGPPVCSFPSSSFLSQNNNQTKPNQTKPTQPNPTQPKPNQPNPTQPNPNQPKPNQTNPTQTNQIKPNQQQQDKHKRRKIDQTEPMKVGFEYGDECEKVIGLLLLYLSWSLLLLPSCFTRDFIYLFIFYFDLF